MPFSENWINPIYSTKQIDLFIFNIHIAYVLYKNTKVFLPSSILIKVRRELYNFRVVSWNKSGHARNMKRNLAEYYKEF